MTRARSRSKGGRRAATPRRSAPSRAAPPAWTRRRGWDSIPFTARSPSPQRLHHARRRRDSGVPPERLRQCGAVPEDRRRRHQPVQPGRAALNLARGEVIVANSNFGHGSCDESVTTYAIRDSGNAAPLRVLVGSEVSELANPTGVAICEECLCQHANPWWTAPGCAQCSRWAPGRSRCLTAIPPATSEISAW